MKRILFYLLLFLTVIALVSVACINASTVNGSASNNTNNGRGLAAPQMTATFGASEFHLQLTAIAEQSP